MKVYATTVRGKTYELPYMGEAPAGVIFTQVSLLAVGTDKAATVVYLNPAQVVELRFVDE